VKSVSPEEYPVCYPCYGSCAACGRPGRRPFGPGAEAPSKIAPGDFFEPACLWHVGSNPYALPRDRATSGSQRVSLDLAESDVVNNALRETLGRPVREAPPFSLITYGRSGRRVHHEPAELDAALENEDRLRQ
jgi:hypothetical protein